MTQSNLKLRIVNECGLVVREFVFFFLFFFSFALSWNNILIVIQWQLSWHLVWLLDQLANKYMFFKIYEWYCY